MYHLLKKFWNWDGIAPGEGGFIQAALMAAPYIMQGLSALGGVFGGKKKYLDPQMLMQKYGPYAVSQLTQQYANHILNSPYGQQLLSSAATSGQEAQTNLAAGAAASGLDASSGGASGASDFAAATAPQIQGGLERGVRADVWKAALPLAQDQANRAYDLEVANNAEQNANNPWAKIGQAASGAAAMFPGQTPAAAPAGAVAASPGTGLSAVDGFGPYSPDMFTPRRRAPVMQ